jgi:hypothetical protein
LIVNPPGICVFCFADSSGDREVSDPMVSPVTVTSSVSAGLFEVSAACAVWISIAATAVVAKTLHRRHIEPDQ